MNIETAAWRGEPVGDGVAERDTTLVVIRRRRRVIIIAAAVGIALIVALLLLLAGRDRNSAAASSQAGAQQAPRVTVVVPGLQQVPKLISGTGTLAARHDMPVGIVGEGGMVSRVLVEAGDWVRAGQVLAVIERSVQAEQARQLAANIDVARADAELAQQELDRGNALVSRGFISKADVEKRTATRDAAVARVKVAQAQLAQQRAQIGRLDVRSPAPGLVMQRNVEPGQVVGPGTGALFHIAENGEMELKAMLSQEDLARLTVGIPASVTPVGAAHSFQGHVWQISPVVDPISRLGAARIAIPYAPELRSGGFAGAEITAGSADAPLLPQSAVMSDERGNYVYIVGPQNKIVRRDVKVGDVSDRGASIAAGLSGNERVVLTAGAFLNPGDKVKPVPAAVQR